MEHYGVDRMSIGRPPRVLLADDFPELLTVIQRLLAGYCEVVGSVDEDPPDDLAVQLGLVGF